MENWPLLAVRELHARKDNVNDQEPHAQDRNKYNPEQTLNSNNYKFILS